MGQHGGWRWCEQWPVLAPIILGPLAIPVTVVPGLCLGTLAEVVPDPASVVRDILNPNTIC